MPVTNAQQPFYTKHFQVLVVLLFVVLLVPGYLLFISPEHKAYQENKNLFIAQEQSLSINKTQLFEYKRNLMSYQDISDVDRQKIGEILPYGPDEANLYVNLSSLASELGADLDSLNIQTDPNKTSYAGDNMLVKDKPVANAVKLRTTHINMKLSSVNYTKVKRCFELLESNTKLLDVQSFQFNPAEGILDLTMITYYLN